ncbi:MAG TPA: hypothetical protein VNB06_18595 [Thermoanaerobaculia bacterium]|nr:hypothetical protein [Thermoanaerobaculia bacterium]
MKTPRRSTHPSEQGREQGREQGSTYIVVLLVLFVLTALGLALTFVTQNEIVIGSQERTIQRAFYAADSGVGLAVSNSLQRDYRPLEVELGNPPGLFGSDLIDRIETSKFEMLNYGSCELCQVNIGDVQYHKVNFSMTSHGLRIARADGGGGDFVPVARREVNVMVEQQPIELPGDTSLEESSIIAF